LRETGVNKADITRLNILRKIKNNIQFIQSNGELSNDLVKTYKLIVALL
jgi:hypothetical protein